MDLYIGERTTGPIFLNLDGAARIVQRLVKRAGIDKKISPHSLRHSFITAALDAGVPLRDVQQASSHSDPRTTMRYDGGCGSLDRHATYIVATFVAWRQPLTPDEPSQYQHCPMSGGLVLSDCRGSVLPVQQ